MHVCHLINSLSVGGGERFVANLVAADRTTTYTVCVLEDEANLAPEIRRSGAEVYLCGERFRFDPRALVRLRRQLKRRRIDLLHTHLPYAQVVGRVTTPGTGIRSIVSTQHSHQQMYHPVMRTLEQLTAGRDDATVAVSEGVRASFSGSRTGRNWRTIHSGIDAQEFRRRVAAQSETERGSTGPVFLNVGRCVPPKAQSVLIEAMPHVTAELPGAKLLIAGDGPLREALQSQVSERGLEEDVHLLGHVSPVETCYATADVFVSSSQIEGLPMTVLEAMAAELPVVASDIPGISEVVVHGKTGYLVRPDEPSRLARAMIETARDDPRQMGRAGFARVRERFSIDRMLASYLDLYESVVA